MDIAHILAFNVALLAAMAAPGPALLIALRQSVANGFSAGMITGLGLGLMAALWTGAALLGLEIVFRIFPLAFSLLKICGALYLFWVAWHLWRDAHNGLETAPSAGPRAFFSGFLVNLGNPKAVLFAASVLVVIFPANLPLGAKAIIVANHFLVEVLVYTGFAALLATAPARQGYLRLKPVLDRIAALVLGGLGLRLLVGR